MPDYTNIEYITSITPLDELIVVRPINDVPLAKRIKLQNLLFDSRCILSWNAPANQDVGALGPNTWNNALLNSKQNGSWLTLNADGSFTIPSGQYEIRCYHQFYQSGQTRIGLFEETSLLRLRRQSIGTANTAFISFEHLYSTNTNKTLSLKYNVSVAGGIRVDTADALLADTATVASVAITKIG